MKINIGLYNLNPGWEMLLDQEGVPYEIIGPEIKELNIADFPCLIIHNSSYLKDPKLIIEFIKDGGLVLFESKIYAEVFNKKVQSKNTKYICPENGSIFASLGIIDFYTQFNIIKNISNNFLDQKLQIFKGIIGKGAICVVPFAVNELLTNYKSSRKKFPADRNELPSEIVSSVSRGKIRKLIQLILKELFSYRELPFIQKWYYNTEHESCFIFRVDTDFSKAEDAAELYKICAGNGINATWFIDTESEEKTKNTYGSMEDQEIAFHCDRHRVFNDYKLNYHYITTGLNKLEKHGISVSGYAAPFGEWNTELASVIEKLGFSYSSEFSLAYDDLPFFPHFNGRKSSVLQIPAHPISLGRLRRSHFSKNEMYEYYRDIIDRKRKNQDPIIIYHHPAHKHFEVFNKVFNYIKFLKLPVLNLQQFAVWWKYRNGIELNCQLSGKNLTVGSNDQFDFYLKITLDDKHCIIPFQNKIDLNSLKWQTEPELSTKIENRNLRKLHWRDLLYNFESYKGKRKR